MDALTGELDVAAITTKIAKKAAKLTAITGTATDQVIQNFRLATIPMTKMIGTHTTEATWKCLWNTPIVSIE